MKVLFLSILFLMTGISYANEQCCFGTCWANGCCPGDIRCNGEQLSITKNNFPDSGIAVQSNISECTGPFGRSKSDADFLKLVFEMAQNDLKTQCLSISEERGSLQKRERIKKLNVFSGAIFCVELNLIDRCKI